MQLKGEERIEAPREKVWEALNDPQVLEKAIPGCETIEQQTPTDMTATVTLRVGPIKASFDGKVELKNLNPPEGYRLEGEGKGGVAGFAKGGADVNLTEVSDGDGDATLLSYDVDAQVGGKLAQLGGRLIDSTAKKLAKQFFADFKKEVEGA